jgi:hypothetical protein
MQKISSHHHQRAAIADFICPDDGYRGKQSRLGHQPKNHMKDNVRDLRHLEAKLKEDREESNRNTAEPFKLSQFRDVSSRVYNNIDNEDKELANNGDFLAKGLSDKRRDELAARKRLERLEHEAKLDQSRQEIIVNIFI